MLAGDYHAAQGYCREALALARRVADPLLEWIALQFSGVTEWDRAAAQHYLQDGAACARAAGEPASEAASLGCLAMIACDQGEYTAAEPLAHEAVRLARASGDPWTQAWALLWRGSAALGRGALHDATAALEAALSAARQLGQPASLTAWILNGLAELNIASGQLEQARTWLVASIKLQNQGGERWQMTQTLDRRVALAAAGGHAERAFRLAGTSDALYERLSAQRPAGEHEKLEHWLQPLRDALGSEAADTAWAQGRALELEDAIALALGSDDTGAPRPRAPVSAGVVTGLTAREREVAALLAHGLTNRQIAEQLVVTERTVAAHVEHLLNKLGFASRHQVGAWAADHGLLN
jgi:DNA-binding CsgD family transcriptional regulator